MADAWTDRGQARGRTCGVSLREGASQTCTRSRVGSEFLDGYTLLVHATGFGEITPGADAVDPGSAGNDDEVGGSVRWVSSGPVSHRSGFAPVWTGGRPCGRLAAAGDGERRLCRAGGGVWQAARAGARPERGPAEVVRESALGAGCAPSSDDGNGQAGALGDGLVFHHVADGQELAGGPSAGGSAPAARLADTLGMVALSPAGSTHSASCTTRCDGTGDGVALSLIHI